MNILIDNPISHMYGPDFLVLYGITILITLTGCKFVLQGNILSSASTEIPSQPDSYEIAYLRDGAIGVAKLVCLDLRQKGLIHVKDNYLERSPDTCDLSSLKPLEQKVFDWLKYPRNLSNFKYDYSLKHAIAKHCQGYQQSLEAAGHFNSEAKIYMVAGISELIILSLGSYKLMVAISQGHYNVLYLIIMAIAATIWLAYLITPRTSRLTATGKLYLNDLQETFSGLESKLNVPPTEPDDNSSLIVAIFDLEKIRGSEHYQDLVNFFIPQFTYTRRSSSYSSSSCSSFSCSSSSCSSSSCSSSSCGGGCGGCGG
jgi:uncharacterized protein (TIGR04222 family)